ncbi:hypothetical protein ACFYQA_16035, partial [Streptomyces sp. NPDC005774]
VGSVRTPIIPGQRAPLLISPSTARPLRGGSRLRGDRCSNAAVLPDERWFGFLADQMIRRGAHKNVQALEADIRAWVKDWSEDPRPFIWTKTAEEILESLARFCRRISGAGH